MNKHFQQAIAALNQTNEAFQAGLISSVQHGDQREAALAAALAGMAATFQVTFKGGRYIDSRGEFRLASTGCFGKRFADLLNTAKPRCGVYGVAILTQEATWCFINHFEVERLVQRFYAMESVKPSVRGQLARRLRAAFGRLLVIA